MDFTVQDLLNSPIIEGWEAVTKGIDFRDRNITDVSVQEYPFAKYIQPGELVLTTALGAEQDSGIYLKMVEDAASVMPSAILFGISYEIRSLEGVSEQHPADDNRLPLTPALPEAEERIREIHIPPEAVRRAEELGIPLILLKTEQSYADIHNAVVGELRDIRMEPFFVLQNQLFNAYFEGRTLEEGAEMIAQALDARVQILDRNHFPLATSLGFEEATCAFRIGTKQEQQGVLYLETKQALSRETERVIRRYVTFPLTLWIAQRRVEIMTETRLRGEFALHLAHDDMDIRLLQEASQLNIPLDWSYRAILIAPLAEDAEMQRILLTETGEIIRTALSISREMGLSLACGTEMGKFVAFLGAPSYMSNVLLEHFLDRWQKTVRSMLRVDRFHAGISREFPGKGGFPEAYGEALTAQGYCDSPGDQVLYFEDARKISIMSALSTQSHITEDAEEVLGPLLAYDRDGGSMELMLTLTTYLQANYNVAETARALSVHRQTLLARLQKIQELTGMSLKDHDDLFVLEVYSRLYRNY